jgi:NADP-dependent 3-hydroxy acid dehydrogenase YdfG
LFFRPDPGTLSRTRPLRIRKIYPREVGMAGALKGRVAVVTGASSGIGAATALLLAEEGASVVLAARRRERVDDLAEEATRKGGRAMALPTDVTRRSEVEALVARTEEAFGPPDILVNSAGVMPLAPLTEARVEDWEAMVDVNLKGILFAVGAVLPGMLRRGSGHIVNVGSLAGRRPFPGGTVYSATKFAVRALTWGMQLELSAAHGIRVTDIQPGVVDTELMDQIPSRAVREQFRVGWEGRRKLRPEDVAQAVLFAVTSPEHVNVNEVLIRPTDQPT